MTDLQKSISTSSLRTNRFSIFLVGFIGCMLTAIVIAIVTKDAGLVAATLVPLVGLVASALGFGNNHDTKVKVAMVNAEKAQ